MSINCTNFYSHVLRKMIQISKNTEKYSAKITNNNHFDHFSSSSVKLLGHIVRDAKNHWLEKLLQGSNIDE